GGLLAGRTGRVGSADSLAAPCDPALAAATVSRPDGRRPTVLLLVWEQPPMTIGRGSFLNELVERAGGANLFADVTVSAGAGGKERGPARRTALLLHPP